jgi:hypothetical protein
LPERHLVYQPVLKNPAADKCLSTFLLPQKGYEKQINATMLITVQTLSIPLIMSFGKLL